MLGDALGDEGPELVPGEHPVVGEDLRDEAQHPVEDVGEDRQRLHLRVEDVPDPLDLGRQRPVGHDDDLLADVLHEGAARHVAVEDEDDVLPVRHEGEVVHAEAVHDGPQVGPEHPADPFGRADGAGRDELGDERTTVGVAVQQPGEAHEPLSRSELRYR